MTQQKIVSTPDMTTSQIDAENTQMTNDLYRLLKKYSGLRNLIRQLKVNENVLEAYRGELLISYRPPKWYFM